MTDPGLVVLSGPPCSGKSTVAQHLADATPHQRRIQIEVDSLFLFLLPTSDRNRRDRMLAYDGAHMLAARCLQEGRGVMLECTYARREQRSSLVTALAHVATPLWVVEVFVTPDEAVGRFRHRDEATDLDEPLLRERVEAFPYSEQALRLVSAAATPEEHARHINDWLAQQPPPMDREAWVQAGRTWD